MTGTKYQVLARRYRPQTFAEVVGQEAVVTTLKNALRFDKAAHAYLFCGSRGVGKTTLARLFAKALNCLEKGPEMEPCNRCSSCQEIGSGQSLDVIEIDGASNRGIDDIRQVNENALYSPSSGRYKIYIIDEVHMLTKEAFNALLKTLEEPPEKAKFFFATTEPHKVLPTIVSRCQRFDLGRIQLSQIIAKLEQIGSDLGRSAEPEALHLIATFADGSLRDAESLFDQILCFAEGTITASAIRAVLGLIPHEHFFALDQAFSETRTSFAFELVETLFSSGKDLAHFYEQLLEHVRNLCSARILGERGLLLPSDLAARYLQSCRLYASSQCLYLLEYLLRSELQIQKSSCQRVALESILLHYIQSKNRLPTEVLVRRLSEMEEAVKSHPPDGLRSDKPSAPSPSRESIRKPEPSPPELSALKPPAPSTPPLNLKAVPFNPFQPAPQMSEELSVGPQKTPSDRPKPASVAAPPQAPPSLPIQTPSAPIKTEALKEQPELPKATAQPIREPKSVETPIPPSENKRPPAPSLEDTLKSTPAATKSTDAPKPIETSPPSPQSQTRYDTLMRFATVELEGTLSLKT